MPRAQIVPKMCCMLGRTKDGDPLTCAECKICKQDVISRGFAPDMPSARKAIEDRLTCPQCSRKMIAGEDCACGFKSMITCRCKKCNGGQMADHKTWNVSHARARLSTSAARARKNGTFYLVRL
eukprot:COSAG06_NODE_5071_length_3747_cov_1.250000_2_plen_124_part_00